MRGCGVAVFVFALGCMGPLSSPAAARAVEPDDIATLSTPAEALAVLEQTIGLSLTAATNFNIRFDDVLGWETYSLYGAATMNLEGATVTLDLGTEAAPGIILKEGWFEPWYVDALQVTISEELSFGGVTLTTGPSGLSVTYNSTTKQLEATGEADLEVEGASMGVRLGDSTTPGMTLSLIAGQEEVALDRLNLDVTSDLVLAGLTLKTDPVAGAAFSYDATQSVYLAYGGATLSVEGVEVGVHLGTRTHPGIVISNGVLGQLNLSIKEDFTLAGLTVKTGTNGVGAAYNRSTGMLDAFGEVDLEFDGQSVAVSLGSSASDPGLQLAIDTATGGVELDALDIDVQTSLQLFGLTLNTSSEDFDFQYNKNGNRYEAFGGLELTIEGEAIDARMGDATAPGLIISNGVIEQLSFAITEHFQIAGLTLATGTNGVGARYNRATDLVDVYGEIDLTFDGQSIGVMLGDATAPGLQLAIQTNGATVLEDINIDINEDFTLFGLELATTPGVGFDFQYNRSNNWYEAFGGLTMTVDGESVGVDLGDAANPGIIVSNGVVEHINMQASADIHVAGFTFEVPTDDPVDIQFTRDPDGDHYLISGEVILSDLWKVDLALGTEQHPGLKIVDGQWDIESLSIDVANIHLGFVTLQNIAVRYSRSLVGLLDLDIDLDVAIPEIGEIDAKIDVANGKLEDVALTYSVSGTSEGLEIADTGVSIAELGADLTNLDQPPLIGFDGTVGIEFGGQIDIAGRNVTLIRVNGAVSVDKDHFYMRDDVLIGAYQPDTPAHAPWKVVLFDGEVVVDLDWTIDDYYFDGSIKLPTDYGLFMESKLVINSRVLDVLIDAGVRIPTEIPVFGGIELEDIGVAVRIDYADPSEDYAAAWTQFLAWTIGVEFEWNKNKFKLLDGAQVTQIEDQIEDDQDFRHITKYVTLPAGASAYSVHLDWGQALPAAAFVLQGPATFDGQQTYDIYLAELLDITPSNGVSLSGGILSEVLNTNEVSFFIKQGAAGEALLNDDFGPLTGLLQKMAVTMSFSNAPGLELTASDVEMQVVGHYTNSSISAPVLGSPAPAAMQRLQSGAAAITALTTGTQMPVQLDYWMLGLHASNATITLYLDDDASGYDGRAIARDLPYGTHHPVDGGSLVHPWPVAGHIRRPHSAYYLYARLDSPGRSPTFSSYSGPYHISPPLHGRVVDSARTNAPLRGMRVFLDEDLDGAFTPFIDRTVLTNPNGEFAFHALTAGVYRVGVIPPPGFEHNPSSGGAPDVYYDFTYTPGTSISVDFHLNQLRSISGYVFVDANENGARDEGEAGLQGALLYLDENGNHQYDAGEVRAHSTQSGLYRFHDVAGGREYALQLLAQSHHAHAWRYQLTTSTNRLQEHSGYDFAVAPADVQEVASPEFVAWANVALAGAAVSQRLAGADADGDGISNYGEFLANTDPRNAGSAPKIRFPSRRGPGLALEIDQQPDATYLIDRSFDLQTWELIREIRGNATEALPVLLNDPGDGGDRGFYRLRLE